VLKSCHHWQDPAPWRYRIPIAVFRSLSWNHDREGHGEAHSSLRAPGDFGLTVQQARLARGLTQTKLAAELSVPQSTISEIESGKATIYVRRLLSIARATGLELTASWEDDDSPRV
jgi:HTH-type transcriptional regulator/antitoxin HipB